MNRALRLRLRHLAASALLAVSIASPAGAQSLGEAVGLAVETNPDIGQARANRQAVDAELAQARGLYLPQVDLEASVGPEWTNDNNTRNSGGDSDTEYLWPKQLSVVLQQMLFDGFATDAEVERQASRVDAAAYRVMERSEFIGLDAVEAYLDVMRLMEIRDLARDNVAIHQRTLGNVRQRQQGGSSSIADVQQSQERFSNAEATLVDVERRFEDARIRYQRIVGQPAGQLTMPAPVAASLPPSLDQAVASAIENNPTIRLSRADLDTSHADYKASESNFMPTLDLESNLRLGQDLDGEQGGDSGFNVLLVARYNLYRGGIDTANRQEQIARIAESRQLVLSTERDVEQLTRETWNAIDSTSRSIELLERQAAAAAEVRTSYRQQFDIGQRSLLDLLDSENELFNTRVNLASSRYAHRFAQYRLLATGGTLLQTLGVAPPAEATADARAGAGVPPTPTTDPVR
jgi:adhesin transport system outer membrane protein